MKQVLALIVAAGLLAGCEGGDANNQAVGAIVGAGIGAALGAHAGHDARPAAMVMGAVAGGLVGAHIGKKLDDADRIKRQQTHYRALEHGRSYDTAGWYNPDTGTSGWVKPEPAYQNQQGQYCREYQESVTIDGKEERAYGTACRQPDGSWKII